MIFKIQIVEINNDKKELLKEFTKIVDPESEILDEIYDLLAEEAIIYAENNYPEYLFDGITFSTPENMEITIVEFNKNANELFLDTTISIKKKVLVENVSSEEFYNTTSEPNNIDNLFIPPLDPGEVANENDEEDEYIPF